MKKGIWQAVGAYVTWGLFPIYWKLLSHVPAIQLMGHRVFWSFLTLICILLSIGKWNSFYKTIKKRNIFGKYFIAAILIFTNWFMYIWAVNSGYVIEASLGYFINPLLSVFLGVIFFHERLRTLQWMPIILAGTGVVYLTIAVGSLPWIPLILASTFGFYGLVKKIAPLNSLFGLTIETGILFSPAIAYLIFCNCVGQGAFLNTGISSDILIISSGLITTVPLLMFSSASRRIPLSLLGIFQYITPTIQFLLGFFIYKESFSSTQLIGYSIIWIALIIFALENYLNRKIKPAIGTIE